MELETNDRGQVDADKFHALLNDVAQADDSSDQGESEYQEQENNEQYEEDNYTETQEPEQQQEKKNYIPQDRLNKVVAERNEAKLAYDAAVAKNNELIQFIQQNFTPNNQNNQNIQQEEFIEAPEATEFDEFAKYVDKKYSKEVEELKREIQRLQEETTKEKQVSARDKYINSVRNQVVEFQQKTPDYADAHEYLMKSIAEDVKDYVKTKEEFMYEIDRELDKIVGRATKAGKNVGAALYDRAKKMGYAGRNNNVRPNLAKIDKNSRIPSSNDFASYSGSPSTSPVSKDSLKSLKRDNQGHTTAEDFRKLLKRV
ncbi:MAG: hypothetical protein AMJ43_07985 [Coxiella sp. DG_40]|nr:MAG: hypothetical protein AMJ43_07985 [Coxiella sp. DG_40]